MKASYGSFEKNEMTGENTTLFIVSRKSYLFRLTIKIVRKAILL